MDAISDDQLTDFCGRLGGFRESLPSPEQKNLLDAILRIAWKKASTAEALEDGFDGCFKPDEADLILKYSAGKVDMIEGMVSGVMVKAASASPPVPPIPDMIKTSPLHGFIK
jgi:hypothetical protein